VLELVQDNKRPRCKSHHAQGARSTIVEQYSDAEDRDESEWKAYACHEHLGEALQQVENGILGHRRRAGKAAAVCNAHGIGGERS